MNPTAPQFEAASRSLTDVLDGVPQDSWSAPSPCPDWSARDVLAHLIDTQRAFLSGQGVELGPAPDVDADPAAAWRDHAQRVREAIADDDLTTKAFDGFFGPTTVGATFAQFYVWDMVVHRWDIARAAGHEVALTDDELDRIEQGADGFGEALYMEGICRPAVQPPADADRQARVLARLGRSAEDAPSDVS
jgi:uncharacterized protein (TIGR03086 family)